MVARVLGKRSRDILVQEDTLPARKRATRASTPKIYEDASCDPEIPQERNVQRSKTCKLRTVQPKHVRRTKPTKETTHISYNTNHELQDENVPPSTYIATPTTNRFKDVLVSTPSTPKHRVRLTGGLLTPRTPRTGETLRTRSQNVFSLARHLFTLSSNPTNLIGRDNERQQLQSFIENAISAKAGGCLYVSGAPGTGKSALAQDLLQTYQNGDRVSMSIVNCVALRTANDVYTKLLEDLASGTTCSTSAAKTYLAKLFTKKTKSAIHLVMLDEIDNLLDTDCDVLYTLFEWSMSPSSSLALIGIANALDLTDRFLPRLKSKGLKPQLLPFTPYTAQQISAIISGKLRSLLPADSTCAKEFTPVMHPAAIQLCGKKIASQTGDIRKAFNLVRRAIDQVEKETASKQMISSPSKQPLGMAMNTSNDVVKSSQIQQTMDELTAETAPRVSIAHVARLASSIFNNGTTSRLTGLNLQQKAVLCSLVGTERRKQERDPYVTPSKSVNKVPTVRELYVKYAALCKMDDGILQPLKDTEFRDVVNSLETLGLVHESKARTSSLLTPTSTPSRTGLNSDSRQVVSAVSEKEMRDSLNGAGADLLRRLLNE